MTVTAMVGIPLKDIVEKFDDKVQVAAGVRLNLAGIDPRTVESIEIDDVWYDEEGVMLVIEMLVCDDGTGVAQE